MSVLLVLSVFGAIPIAFIGVWPRFDAGNGTRVQRVWTNFWLVMDICCGPWLDIHSERENLFEETLFLKAIIRPHVSWGYFTAFWHHTGHRRLRRRCSDAGSPQNVRSGFGSRFLNKYSKSKVDIKTVYPKTWNKRRLHNIFQSHYSRRLNPVPGTTIPVGTPLKPPLPTT